MEPREELEESNKLSIRLARTRSRIVALPGHDPKTIRGFSSPRLVIVDEAAFVLDETCAALVPMLAASPEGRIALLSTPFLQQGFFLRGLARLGKLGTLWGSVTRLSAYQRRLARGASSGRPAEICS
jgi:hypothetical protein